MLGHSQVLALERFVFGTVSLPQDHHHPVHRRSCLSQEPWRQSELMLKGWLLNTLY